jgi:glycosyltransferase involved in cell wall biosynthesis
MKQRRILYVAKTARGGSAFSLYHLVSGLDRRRYEPTVLFYAQEHPYIGDRLAELGIHTITLEKTHRQPSPAPARSVSRRDIRRWLETHFGEIAGEVYVCLRACYQFIRWEVSRVLPIVRAIREKEIDLVHINTGLRHGKAGIVAAWITRTPCICHVRMFRRLNRFDRFFARFVHSFIHICRAVAENYVAQGLPASRGSVIHNGICLDEFSTDSDSEVELVRSEFGWTARECLVGVVGRLDRWKGHEYFLEAMAEVARQVPNVRGLIVGEPENTPLNWEYYRKLKSLTGSLGLEDKVIYTGFRDDVPRLMSALDVVVLSSSAPEPFGRVVIEGMAAGKPVVATAAGGVLDIIEDGLNGLLVPCKDSKAMAEAILQLLSDRGKAERMGLAARQRVAERFTVEHHVAKVQSVYESVMGVEQTCVASIKTIQ